jgi:hypothetical protein
VAAFLASSDTSFMTASEVAVDGGLASRRYTGRLGIWTTRTRCSRRDEREHDPSTGCDSRRARPRGNSDHRPITRRLDVSLACTCYCDLNLRILRTHLDYAKQVCGVVEWE